MRGNIFGKMFSLTSFGESHGPALGVVIDGMAPGLEISLEDLQGELEKRAPGRSLGTTSRYEPDEVEILSGVFEGKTLGSPLCVLVRNKNQRSQDYDSFKNTHRPGHSDKTTSLKFGIRDHRGGGRSSGRETLSRVIGGYFAGLMLPELKVQACLIKLGPFETCPPSTLIPHLGHYRFAEPHREQEIESYLVKLKEEGNSTGGIVYVQTNKIPPGLGEPCFDKLKADLAKSILSIGGVTGFSYGTGNLFAQVLGKEAQNFGGIEGGISNGDPLQMQVVFKPTSTVGEKAKKGRHDPCIMPRACVVVESMIKIVLADHFLRQRAYA